MNREQEYQDLLFEISHTPAALETTVARAQARARKRAAVRNCFVAPISTIAAVLVIFMVLVNVSPVVASTMDRIPGLRQLAEAVSFSRSLSAAVENEFVQHIGQEQTINGVTMRIEHVIVDRRRLHIFYTLDSQKETSEIALRAVGGRISGVGEDRRIILGGFGVREMDSDDGLFQLTSEFSRFLSEEEGRVSEDVPNIVVFERHVFCNNYNDIHREPIAIFEFTLELDPAFTQTGEVIELNHDFILDGQSLTMTTVEINPTHTRVEIIGNENNTAWVRALWFYLENEHGERFYPPPNTRGRIVNISARGDTMAVETHFLESAFFTESETLYMVIEEVMWLDKDMEFIRINFEDGTADRLPENIRLESVVQTDDGCWILTFEVFKRREYNIYQYIYQFIYTKNPELHDDLVFRSLMSMHGWYLHETHLGLFFRSCSAIFQNTVSLTPQYSRTVQFDPPIVIPVR